MSFFERNGDALRKLAEAYRDADQAIRRWHWLDQMGMSAKELPTVDKEALAQFQALTRQTIQGFQITRKASDRPDKQLRGLGGVEEFSTLELAQFMAAAAHTETAPAVEAFLPYAHFLQTLVALQDRGEFSYADQVDMGPLDLGATDTQTSQWAFRPSHDEYQWQLMFELRKALEIAVWDLDANDRDLIDPGHFFAAGADSLGE